MALGKAYLDDVVFSFRKQKELAEKAFHQIDSDEDFFRKPAEHSNSIALIIKHLAGNLASRWTDFLTTDGEKLTRDRDSEFVIGPEDSRANLLAAWEAGWAALFRTLQGLNEGDLNRSVTIRGEPHSVLQAINRALTHASYHAGQITYLSRMLKTEGWNWITIPPGQSGKFKAARGEYLK
ncbi:MAG TPA: DUF1572 family protein [Gemmataceae bacterium]|nr:DUF1572 family protein [Gemmataceae bacterium]